MNDQMQEMVNAYKGNCDLYLNYWGNVRSNLWFARLKHETTGFKFELSAEGPTPEEAINTLHTDWTKSQKLSLANLAPVLQIEADLPPPTPPPHRSGSFNAASELDDEVPF